jgi:hypothetical protein
MSSRKVLRKRRTTNRKVSRKRRTTNRRVSRRGSRKLSRRVSRRRGSSRKVSRRRGSSRKVSRRVSRRAVSRRRSSSKRRVSAKKIQKILSPDSFLNDSVSPKSKSKSPIKKKSKSPKKRKSPKKKIVNNRMEIDYPKPSFIIKNYGKFYLPAKDQKDFRSDGVVTKYFYTDPDNNNRRKLLKKVNYYPLNVINDKIIIHPDFYYKIDFEGTPVPYFR